MKSLTLMLSEGTPNPKSPTPPDPKTLKPPLNSKGLKDRLLEGTLRSNAGASQGIILSFWGLFYNVYIYIGGIEGNNPKA